MIIADGIIAITNIIGPNLIFDIVVPSTVKLTHEKLGELINESAKKINPTSCCVITFDNDFRGR